MSDASFADLLSSLAIAHESELESVRFQCDAAIASLKEAHSRDVDHMTIEIQSLHKQLSEGKELDAKGDRKIVWIDALEDVSPALHESSQGNEAPTSVDVAESHDDQVAHTLRPGWSRQAIWGQDNVTLAKAADGTMKLHLMPSVLIQLDSKGRPCLDCEKGVFFPHSTFRTFWDLVSLMLIIGDVLILPFSFAFDPETTTGSAVIEHFSLFFWTLDMMQGPFIGFFENGHYISSRSRVVKHYLKTWFVVDVLVVLPEWTVYIVGTGSDSPVNAVAGFGKVVKTIRVARILRFLRIAKVKHLLAVYT